MKSHNSKWFALFSLDKLESESEWEGKTFFFFGISIVCSCVHFKKEINYDEQTNAVKETHSIYIYHISMDMYMYGYIVTFYSKWRQMLPMSHSKTATTNCGKMKVLKS